MLLDMTKHFTGLRKIRVRREEARLLSMADGVVYVSPFTMQVQKETFPDAAAKMFWVNQAAMPTERVITPNRGNVPADIFSIGYFGQYTDTIRNMHPLYQAVKEMQGIHLTIGGAPAMLNFRLRSRQPSLENCLIQRCWSVKLAAMQ